MLNKKTVTINNKEYDVFKMKNDVNGNPRYIIHFLDLGLEEYEPTNLTRKAGLAIRRNFKAFGGGFVFQSYNVKASLKFILKTLAEKE